MKRGRVVFVALLVTTFFVASAPTVAAKVRQLAVLTASDGELGDQFGNAVAITGGTVVVGAWQRHSSGAVYIFVRGGGRWVQAAELAPGVDGDAQDFGIAVAISGSTLVVGARGFNQFSGAVYVFVKPVGGWHDMAPTATLTVQGGQGFLGAGVAISSDGATVVAGAGGVGTNEPGAAYVFTKPAGRWQDTTVPTATLSAAESVNLGNAVAIDGNTIVAGAEGISRIGGAYVFVEPLSGWQDAQPAATLTPSDGNSESGFGASVAVSGTTVVVGSPATAEPKAPGAAYVFVEPLGGWQNMTQTAELTLSSQVTAWLGSSVIIVGDVVLAGAPKDVIGRYEEGALFGYVKPPGGWQDSSTPTGSVPGENDLFGSAVAVSGNLAVVGAPFHFSLIGAAYVFAEQ